MTIESMLMSEFGYSYKGAQDICMQGHLHEVWRVKTLAWYIKASISQKWPIEKNNSLANELTCLGD